MSHINEYLEPVELGIERILNSVHYFEKIIRIHMH